MMGAGALLLLGFVCLCSSAVTAEEEASEAYATPAFCRHYECPKYKTVKQYETFEKRLYEQSRWVTTQLELDFFGLGIYKSFRRLFDYINGQNSEGITIKMAVPVRIYVPLINPSDKNATMSFFVPSTLSTPPQPLRADVYLENIPPMYVYVKSFGGFAVKSDFEKKSKFLSEELNGLRLPFDDTFGAAAAYNDPLTLFNRHNEVWYNAL
ncbi:heme-binding protein 2-like [Spea bombifrons]|uniref:heme-binding protein 2-like n=1 Tax=Spea bombifrons TaxID=233779 RepID=UPI00234AC66E|nr:heme-binding protein 2-like [Spea bombifrons]